jgi:hypothetical protein
LPNDLSIIERYREHHHAIAKMIAVGMTDSMIRQRTGVSTRRLTLLRADPTFMDHLVHHYAKIIDEKWHENVDTWTDLGMSAMIRGLTHVNEHFDQAEDAGELVPLNQAHKVAMDLADRFGRGKTSTVNVNIDFASALDKAIARSGVKTIEGRVADPPHQIEASPPIATQPSTGWPQEVPAVEQPPTRLGPRSFELASIKRRRVA